MDFFYTNSIQLIVLDYENKEIKKKIHTVNVFLFIVSVSAERFKLIRFF